MIVLAPRYDIPEIRPANDRFWQGVADRLRDAGWTDGLPDRPIRTAEPTPLLGSPDLLLAQVSPYALTGELAAKVRVIAAPRYRAPGISGGRYRAFMLVRETSPIVRVVELRGTRCAVSEPESNTGMNLLRAAVAPLSQAGRFFGSVIETGSHLDSLKALAEERVDVASIDCMVHALVNRYRPELVVGTRILAVTAATPAPPFVTAGSADDDLVNRLLTALQATAADPDLAETRAALFLDGFEPLPERAYRVVRTLEAQAAARGYPRIA